MQSLVFELRIHARVFEYAENGEVVRFGTTRREKDFRWVRGEEGGYFRARPKGRARSPHPSCV